MTTYYDVRANLHGQDREDAVQAMEDDDKFDRWLAQYDRNQKLKAAKAASGKPSGRVISNESYLANHAKVYTPEE